MEKKSGLLLSALLVSVMGVSTAQAAVDADAAQDFLKKEKCTKCHSVDKTKSGPSLKSIAKEFKGKSDAEAQLVKHITSGPMVEVDGAKEAHAKPKNMNEADIKNVVQFILSQ